MQVHNIRASDTAQAGVTTLSHSFHHCRSGDTLSEEMRMAFHAVPAGILFVNRLGIVDLANKSAKALFQKHIEGCQWRSVVTTLFEPQKDDGLEVSLVNGRKVKFSISKIPGIPGQLIHLTDLTQTRTLQAKVSHMQRLSALGKMMASLAHQLRTPLSAALLYARNLQTTGISGAIQQRFSDKLICRLKDLEKQINDMLLFAKSGKQDIIEAIDLATLVTSITEEFSETVSGSVSVHFDNQCNNAQISGNRTAITGAINNLFQNALSVGASNINFILRESQQNLELSIADNGPGVPESHINKIFEPFYTTRAQGTGLGLAVVRAVMASHKGRAFAQNQSDGGAKFTLVFPFSLTKQSSQFAQNNEVAKPAKIPVNGELA